MDKQPKIVKRQRARLIESKTDPMPIGESYEAQADESVSSAERAEIEQSIESVDSPLLGESWSAIDSSPLSNYPTVCVWQEELREIRWECDWEAWESCPYD